MIQWGNIARIVGREKGTLTIAYHTMKKESIVRIAENISGNMISDMCVNMTLNTKAVEQLSLPKRCWRYKKGQDKINLKEVKR